MQPPHWAAFLASASRRRCTLSLLEAIKPFWLKPFWLKAFPAQKPLCSFASRVTRFMPRKGWRTVQVPDGWLQVLRGPRPPSVKWSKATPQSKSAVSSHSRPSPAGGQRASVPPPLRHTSKPPEQVAADAVGQEACGAGIGCCRTGLRNRKQARYAKLLAEAAIVDVPPVVSELQERINALVLERDALRAAPVIRGIPKEAQGTWMGDLPRVEDIPPMPTSDMQDLAGRMSQPQLRLFSWPRLAV